jgi:serpin B
LATSANAFAFDLFRSLKSAKHNFVFSPASAFAALTVLGAGARSHTEAEAKKVLHIEGSLDVSLGTTGKLFSSFQHATKGVILESANRVFAEKTYGFDPSYIRRTEAAFGAAVAPLDFQGAPEQARTQVNQWVADRTTGRIKDLLPTGSISGDTRLVVVSAINLTADWAKPFDKMRTSPAPFRSKSKPEQSVPTMHAEGQFAFAAIEDLKVLDLPYAGGDLVMTFILPDKIDGLDSVEGKLPGSFSRWISRLKVQPVTVALPTFSIEPVDSVSLSSALKALGMTSVFDPKRADLTGIAKSPTSGEGLYLSEVFHKAFIRVDEKGTEAAAATGALAAAGAAPPGGLEFRADHPFLFALRHAPSGLILFLGREADPTTIN